MLVPMRMQLEGLSEKQAVDAVLRDNIHGLELDQRCVELAAFALALEAWRYPNAGGYRVLPELQLACSGMSIAEAQKEWKDLAKGDEALTDAIAWMSSTFKDAPTLGSLIEVSEGDRAKYIHILQTLHTITQRSGKEDVVASHGLIKVVSLLGKKYQWVPTNVPYKKTGEMVDIIFEFLSNGYPDARRSLETCFVHRCHKFLDSGGVSSLVLPQNWLFLSGYKDFRENLLKNFEWNMIARLGAGAFDTISGEHVKAILINFVKSVVPDKHVIPAIDAANDKLILEKSKSLSVGSLELIPQHQQFDNPDSRFTFANGEQSELLAKRASGIHGTNTKDSVRFIRLFNELPLIGLDWELGQTTVDKSVDFGGMTNIYYWQQEKGDLHKLAETGKAILAGGNAWEKKGVSVRQVGHLPVSLYNGNKFDQNCAAIIPNNTDDLAAIWCFTQAASFNESVREIDQSLKVTNSTLVKIPFDLEYWRGIALDVYPHGLPLPYTNDITQWIFHGHPCASVIWDDESKTTAVANLRQDETVLQVAVARLLGYQWPAELDPEMELAPEMREVMKKNADFAGLIDDDGIVCIPAVRGEKTAAKRLEAILHKAYGDEWTSSVEQNLLKAVKAKDLESWLRDKFFDQHSKLFQHRPFIWQVWDGLKDGFSALVNYHKLDYKGLERLIYTYLDDWISTQKRDIADGKDGADIRLTAAENLKTQLEAILAGEKGLDIFVRWKPLEEQPIGWNPDLNDGVRLNIRPFMLAKDVGKKGAGVLRGKPNIHWKKDRGTDVASAPWFDLGPVYGEKEGSRINDHHLTLAKKKAAREQAND